MKEPPEITAARAAVERYERDGVCPAVDRANYGCVWTCWSCKATMPRTTCARTLERYHVRCACAASPSLVERRAAAREVMLGIKKG